MVEPFCEKFFQFPFKEAVISNLFDASRESVIEAKACKSRLTIMKFKFMYMLMVVIVSSYISMYLICYMRVYPKVSRLAAWSENCKWYSSLPLGALVLLFYESV
jgi:hypothetical protein